MDNPFDWDYMRTVPGPNEVFGPFAVAFLVLFSVGLLASIVVYNGWARNQFRDPVLHRMARKWAGIAIVLFGLGLFFFLIRWLQIDPFGLARRMWLWASLLSILVLVGYAIWDYRTHYEALRAQYDEQQRRKSISKPTGKGRTTTTGQSSAGAAVPAGPRPRPVRRRRKS